MVRPDTAKKFIDQLSKLDVKKSAKKALTKLVSTAEQLLLLAEYCTDCSGTGQCSCCSGSGDCPECHKRKCEDCDYTGNCMECSGSGDCPACEGEGAC